MVLPLHTILYHNTQNRVAWVRGQRQEALDIVERTRVGFLDLEEYNRASALPQQLQAASAAARE